MSRHHRLLAVEARAPIVVPPTHSAAGLVVQAPGTKGPAPLCPPGGPFAAIRAARRTSLGATLGAGFRHRVARVPGHDSPSKELSHQQRIKNTGIEIYIVCVFL